ncbi:hypothetical protein C8R44DRAFT_753851 [Mycena epipterygia]|nr:hypothetical protein C8R44DRAFT_753851 [Mycena epipterygia]
MDRLFASDACRPSAGSIWITTFTAILVFLVGIVWILEGKFGIGVGVGIWFGLWLVERFTRWIRWRGWRKEKCWKDILVRITLGSALAALSHVYHRTPYLSAVMPRWSPSTSLDWIAAHIYFVWSPELMCIGLVVFVVGGWISAFTHAHRASASPYYSCDWARWCGRDFFVPRTERSDCDALISGACGVPGTIVPVAYIVDALENDFLFVADGIYYIYNPMQDCVWRFDRETYANPLEFICREATYECPREAIATAIHMSLEEAEDWDRIVNNIWHIQTYGR